MVVPIVAPKTTVLGARGLAGGSLKSKAHGLIGL